MRAVAFKPVIGIVRQWQPTATTPLSLQPNICATCFRKLHSPFISPPLSFYRTWSQHLLDRNCLRSFVYQQQQQQFIHHVTFQFDPNPRRVFENASIFQIEKERKKKLDSPILDELLEQRSKCVDRKKSTQVSSSSRLSGVAKTDLVTSHSPLDSNVGNYKGRYRRGWRNPQVARMHGTTGRRAAKGALLNAGVSSFLEPLSAI